MTGNLPSTRQTHPDPKRDRASIRAAIHPDRLNPVDRDLLCRAAQGIRLRDGDAETIIFRMLAIREMPRPHSDAA
ncbi:MAG: hypothetical protein IIB54_14970 [Planctomycetes bacterium]|nr:hypothetical protein [Planctomycetota bacterium]